MVQEVMNRFLKMTDDEIIATLYYLGEEFVNICKISGNYMDRTGNLRSSIGCAVMKDGEIIKSIHYVSTHDDEGKGERSGVEFSEEIRSQFPQGYFLVVYAGMHYAIYVESIERYSVISSFLPDSDKFVEMLSDLAA